MTVHVDLADSEIDPESPGNTSIFTKLRDNPIATYEGNNPTKIVDGALSEPGQLKLIETQTASASASIVFSTGIAATEAVHIMKFSHIVAGATGTDLIVAFSTDGGSTYVTSTDHQWTLGASTGSNQTTMVAIPSINSNAAAGASGSIEFHDLNSSKWVLMTHALSIYDGVSAFTSVHGSAALSISTAINAIKFTASAGSIAQGEFSLYKVIN